jgi:hypothetical protein
MDDVETLKTADEEEDSCLVVKAAGSSKRCNGTFSPDAKQKIHIVVTRRRPQNIICAKNYFKLLCKELLKFYFHYKLLQNRAKADPDPDMVNYQTIHHNRGRCRPTYGNLFTTFTSTTKACFAQTFL